MKIALLGYGKMGKMIEELLLREKDHEIILRVNSSNCSSLTIDSLSEADVAIEFSNPASVLENIKMCLKAEIPVVAGTTGWHHQLPEIKSWCEEKQGAIVYASNFSIGVNIFFEVNEFLAKLMKLRTGYVPRLTEIHHTKKKDAPSGTAITLAADILKEFPQKTGWINHESDNPSELIILSRREDAVTGVHTVEYTSEADKIEIRHEAFSREGFAEGAIRAAEWIIGKKGMYEFRNIINQL